MIQDILPHRLFNQYVPNKRPDASSRIIAWKNGQMLMKIDQDQRTLAFPRSKDFDYLEITDYLFSLDEEPFFLAFDPEVPEGFTYCNLREIRRWNLEPRAYAFAAFTAHQLAEWYENTTFCGKCGHRMQNSPKERARTCPKCGGTIYPRINPAVIVGVTWGEKLLITRYKGPNAINALVAGFTEIGETFEETVAREVMEETGLTVKNIRYYKSQPWGIASDILAGYYCDVDGDPTIHRDDNELKYAEWVQREEIELQPSDYSLTNEMMLRFKEGLV